MQIYPPDFVPVRLKSGDVGVVIAMLDSFYMKMDKEDDASPSLAAGFARKFLILLMNELDDFKSDQSIDDSPLLTVWRELAYFGIEPSAINEFLEGERTSDTT